MQKPSTPATQTDLNSLDDSIPSHISLRLQKSHFQPRKRPSSSQKSSKSLQQVSLDSLILDKDLNYAQKERIAEAILKEKTDELEPIKQSRRPEVHLRPHIDAHRQRFAYQPKLFGVVSHSAPLLPPYMKDRQVEIQRHKEVVGHGPTEYRWGPKAVPTVPAYVPSITSKDEYNSECLTRAEIIAENKRFPVSLFLLTFC